MKVLWIIFLASFIWTFTKFEGNNLPEYDFFPFYQWSMTVPDYVFGICLSLVPACFVWAFVDLATEKRREIKQMAWIVSFKLPWFLLTANMTFFRIKLFDMGVIPIGYNVFMFALLGLVVLKATLNEPDK